MEYGGVTKDSIVPKASARFNPNCVSKSADAYGGLSH